MRTVLIKPIFFRDEKLAGCEPAARLLFAGLWMCADKNGELEDRPQRIKVEVLPYDDCDIEDLLGQLESREFIRRSRIDSVNKIIVTDWKKWQKVHRLHPVRQELNRIREQVREVLVSRDGEKCRQCGSSSRLEIDHIFPVCKGGDNNMGNLQLLCRSCNHAKGART